MYRIASLLVAAMLAAIEPAAASEILSVPVVVPFTAQTKGTVLELDVRLREERGYSIILQLGFVRGDASSRRRIAQFAGTGERRAEERPLTRAWPYRSH